MQLYKSAPSTSNLGIWWYKGLNCLGPYLFLTGKADSMSHAAGCSLCSDQGMSDRFSCLFSCLTWLVL